MRIPPPLQLASAVGTVVFEMMSGSDLDDDRPTPKRIEELAIIGATDDDMADRFLVSPEFIRGQFARQLRRGRAIHRIALRRAQFTQATRGFIATILIWLGRNSLGQSTNPVLPGRPEPIEDDD